jgi:pyruvate/2-oxoacid:ferredoxin oxidoreductase beta subunit
MAHRTSYVMSGTIAHVNHLLESYIDGLNSRRPALFNIYAVCPPEHGVGDDKSVDQSKLAVEAAPIRCSASTRMPAPPSPSVSASKATLARHRLADLGPQVPGRGRRRAEHGRCR